MASDTPHDKIIIYSSARNPGNTTQQVEQFAKQDNTPIVYLDGLTIHPYRYDNLYEKDDFYEMFDNLLAYQHWILASPVYWYSTTSQMKIFIDRITDYMDDTSLQPKLRRLRSKRFSLLSNSIMPAAPDAFVDMFKYTFSYLGMEFVDHHHKRMV